MYLIKSIIETRSYLIPFRYRVTSCEHKSIKDDEELYRYLKMWIRIYKHKNVRRVNNYIIINADDKNRVKIYIYQDLCVADVAAIKELLKP